jgi:hypothetical protein
MTSALLAVAMLTLAGLPLAAWLDPSRGWRWRGGAGFMLGAGIVALLLLFATFASIAWSVGLVAAGLALVALGTLPLALWLPKRAAPPSATPLALVADAATLCSVAGYALFATVARPWEWDFWAIWGLKAKEFFLARAVNFEFLARPDNVFAHPDYPPLLPLVYDLVAIFQGVWDDRWLGVVSVAFAGAMLLVMREELERQSGSAIVGAFGTLALSGVVCSGWVGLGEGPLVAASASGLAIVSRGLRDDAPRTIVAGSLLLGVAGLVKNEGVSFIAAAVVVTLVVSRRRWALVALPSVAMIAPWLLARLGLKATTDVFEGGFVSRAAERLSDPVGFVTTLAGGMYEKPELWLIALLALALHPPAVRRERFLLGVAALQASSYIAVYAGTLNDLASHVQSSVGRVSSHLAPLAAIVAVLASGELLRTWNAAGLEGENERERET